MPRPCFVLAAIGFRRPPPAKERIDELIKGDEHLLQIAPHHFVEKSTGWKAMTIFPSSSFVFAFSIASRSFHFS